MAYAVITFDVMGVAQYDRAFEVLAVRVDDMRAPLEKVLHSLRSVAVTQFRTQGGAGYGAKWAPLNPEYAKAKARKWGAGRPIMVASGNLRDDLTLDGVISLTDDELVYGPSWKRLDGKSNAKIAAYHQEGRGNNPVRRVVAVPEYVKHEWDQFFLTWLRDLEKEQGLR